MKKVIFFSLFACCFGLIHGQANNKKEHFYNPERELISKRKFDKSNLRLIAQKIIENDTAIIGYEMYRRREGKLNIEDLKSFHDLLKKTVNESVDTTKTIIIHYYFNSCNKNISEVVSNKKYFKILKRFPKVLAYFITEKNYNYPSKYLKTSPDNYNFFKEIFKDRFHCSNYLIIKPNGEYKIIYGEYDIIGVLDHAVY